ncbi:FkbM family methyltransferase [Opitutaceae bacterium TAV3]|nr:FkbM family methyltransferase [Opitutaceae bacterium TAV3]
MARPRTLQVGITQDSRHLRALFRRTVRRTFLRCHRFSRRARTVSRPSAFRFLCTQGLRAGKPDSRRLRPALPRFVRFGEKMNVNKLIHFARSMNPLCTRLLLASRLGLLPVRIRHGLLRGSRWTLWPHSSYWRGNYEPDVQAALARHVPRPGVSAWDLGAHFGFYSLWLARAVGPKGEVTAIEPDPVSFIRLRRHVRLNPWAPVRAFACAASDHEGAAHLIQNQGAGATTSHLPYDGETPSLGPVVEIRTQPLDTLARCEGLRPPVLVKIDVEGHAAAALRGAAGTLALHHPRLLISLHSPEECAGVHEQLAPLGYRPAGLDDRPLDWDETLFRTVWYHVNA